jgi:hypothetical protein
MMVDLVMDLARDVRIHARDGGGYEPFVRRTLHELIKLERNGLSPSEGELDVLVQELLEEQGEYYLLCDKTSGEPVEDFPETYFDSEPSTSEELDGRGLVWRSVMAIEAEAEATRIRERDERMAEAERKRKYLTNEERDAVLAFAKANGKQWKKHLTKQWESGTADTLQHLLAHDNFGHKWLSDFKLPRGFWK